MASELTHFDEHGASRMVDVGQKAITSRSARASALVRMSAETMALVRDQKLSKGDVLEVSRLAGIMAAKRTAELIPLCHTLPLDSVTIDFSFPDVHTIRIEGEARCTAKTGVEMEALTAVSVAALTIYDMCKSAQRGIVIEEIRLEEKSGGKSGDWKADQTPDT
jgi:cyclic pyranopterin phosphate synthase